MSQTQTSTSKATRVRRRRAELERWARSVADAHPDPAHMTVAEMVAEVEADMAEVCG